MSLEDAKKHIDLAVTRKGYKGYSFENTFAGAPSFLRRTWTKDLTGVDLAVTGIPFDQAVTNRPGARLGPRAIREASALLAVDAPYGWGFEPLLDFAIADYGDMAFDYARVADVPAVIEAHVAGILKAGAGAILLGGDHSISLPSLRAHHARHGPVALLQFDAHTDTWADKDGSRIDHGTLFYKAVQEGLIDADRSVQVGIRTDNPDTLGLKILDAAEVHEVGAAATAARIREVVGDAKVYLSFDIDGLDPAYAPGTGTPVWGGLTSAQAARILRDIAGIDLVGGDVVEVSPPFDHAGITALAGAHVAMALVCLWCWTRRGG